jgi:hypothetical protein
LKKPVPLASLTIENFISKNFQTKPDSSIGIGGLVENRSIFNG